VRLHTVFADIDKLLSITCMTRMTRMTTPQIVLRKFNVIGVPLFKFGSCKQSMLFQRALRKNSFDCQTVDLSVHSGLQSVKVFELALSARDIK